MCAVFSRAPCPKTRSSPLSGSDTVVVVERAAEALAPVHPPVLHGAPLRSTLWSLARRERRSWQRQRARRTRSGTDSSRHLEGEMLPRLEPRDEE
jgi:hypothetical protein